MTDTKIYINAKTLTRIILHKPEELDYTYYEFEPKKTILWGLITTKRELQAGWYSEYGHSYSSPAYTLKFVNNAKELAIVGKKLTRKARVTYYRTEKDYVNVYYDTLNEAEDIINKLIEEYNLQLAIIKDY